MSHWQMLEISPTVDTKIIKRAYAAKLKLYHPEDDPEGFQKLREAYESALKEAKYLQEVKSDNHKQQTHNIIQEDETTDRKQGNISVRYKETHEKIDTETMYEQFMNRVEEIYKDFFLRIDVNQWKILLENEDYWSLDLKNRLNKGMITFLMDHYWLPNKVWALLNQYFFWTEQEQDLCKQFPRNSIQFLMGEIHCKWGLDYHFLNKEQDFNYDLYIDIRENAYEALKDNDLRAAWQYMNDAYKLYQGDPDLLRMFVMYFLKRENIEKALETLDQLILLDAKNVDGYLNRADLFIKQGKINEAYYDYQKVLSFIPDNMRALKGLAECYFYMNNLYEAKLLYEQMIENYPYDLDARIQLMEINKRIVDQLTNEISMDPNKTAIKYELAKIYFELDLLEECTSILEKMNNSKKLSAEMYLLLGSAYVKNKNLYKGIDYFNKGLEAAYKEGENGYEILIQRGIAYLEKENYDAAIKDLTCALKIYRCNAELLHNLADAYRYKSMYDQCIDLSNEAIEINPSNWKYYSTRGLAYYALEDYKQAKKDHEVVLNHEYHFSEAWYRKGYCHIKLHEFEEAIECFETAIEWDTNEKLDKDIHYYLATAHFMLENHEKALEEINLYGNYDSQGLVDFFTDDYDSSGYILCGDIHRAMGNMEMAKERYYEAHCTDPDNEFIIRLMGHVHLIEGEYKDAAKYLCKIYEEYPEDEWLIQNLTWACIEAENFKTGEKAVSYYKECIKNHTMEINPPMFLYCGIIYYQLGLYEDAEKELMEAVELGFKGDAYSYLSMVYYELGNMENALDFSEKALAIDPYNVDYETRHEGILNHKEKKTFLGIFNKRPSSQKTWPSTILLQNHELEDLDHLNIDIGDGDDE